MPSQTVPNRNDFEKELSRMLEAAAQEGLEFVDISSGTLHRRVGGYPSNNHRMPWCCDVMRGRMNRGDVILSQPPSGYGASLTIHYLLKKVNGKRSWLERVLKG